MRIGQDMTLFMWNGIEEPKVWRTDVLCSVIQCKWTDVTLARYWCDPTLSSHCPMEWLEFPSAGLIRPETVGFDSEGRSGGSCNAEVSLENIYHHELEQSTE